MHPVGNRAAFAEEIGVYRPVLYEEGFLATFGVRDVFFFLSAIAAAGFIGTGAGMD